MRRIARPLNQLKLNFFAQFRLRGRSPARSVEKFRQPLKKKNWADFLSFRTGRFWREHLIATRSILGFLGENPSETLIKLQPGKQPAKAKTGRIMWLAACQSQGVLASSFCQLHTLVLHVYASWKSHRILFAFMRNFIIRFASTALAGRGGGSPSPVLDFKCSVVHIV